MRTITVALMSIIAATAFCAGRMFAPTAADAQVQFSHFRCYTAESFIPATHPVPVRLTDQFLKESNAEVLRPAFFCAPVMKTLLKQKPYPVKGPLDHLTCYTTEGGKPVQTIRTIANQLGRMQVRDLTPKLLCVPTFKQER